MRVRGVVLRFKNLFLSLIIITGIFMLTGCQSKWRELPDNPIVFQSGEFVPEKEEVDTEDEDGGYRTVEYNDKVYIMYGEIKTRGLFMFQDFSYAFGDCLGYVEDDTSDLIYALENESTDEWLIEYYYSGLMDPPPVVLRELSTKENGDIPDSVESFDYDYWK